ncbi:tumor necrosis factor receptor superfamily member 4 isoform X1 [Rhinolophus sinicus]|uniref:tumor necrosis factor receptor superfamily member 4 isoform X1 n=1 Tax=Rhinolophus sinicus TaxID=89399 RepID=UPI003D794751
MRQVCRVGADQMAGRRPDPAGGECVRSVCERAEPDICGSSSRPPPFFRSPYSHILQGKTQTPASPAREPRMCVGAQPPRASYAALLFLGLVLGSTAQQNCAGDTYPNGNKCCHECQPGYWMESRCTQDHDTICIPCKDGFYNEGVNYDEACKPCTQCNQRSGSEIKWKCSATRDTVCHCRPGTQPQGGGYKHGVDCAPCPQGHFSLGNNRACKPWTNCTLAGKRTLRAATNSSDAVCENRRPPSTLPLETRGPPARPPTARPPTAQPTTAWPRTSQAPSTPSTEPPKGPELAAVLGLGLGLGLLGPVAAALILLLHCKVCRLLPAATKSPASGPPSKRSTLTPTAPWPRSERCRWDGRVVGCPQVQTLHPVTSLPCHPPCTVVGAPGLAPWAQLCMLCILPTQGGTPNKLCWLMGVSDWCQWAGGHTFTEGLRQGVGQGFRGPLRLRALSSHSLDTSQSL